MFRRTNNLVSVSSIRSAWLAVSLCISMGLAGCDSDLETDDGVVPISPEQPGAPMPSTPGQGVSNDAFSLQLSASSINMVEGAGTVSVGVSVQRQAQPNREISLVAQGLSSSDENYMSWQLTDASLSPQENSAELILRLAIGPRPIMAQTRTFQVSASDGINQPLAANLTIQVQPTSRPDVYLLVGQSNMVGFSETGAKQATTGGADAPNERIRQLNVTGNDGENFAVAADFTNPANIHNLGLPFTRAVDPLHDGFDTRIDGKAGDMIGPALSFAKRALVDTSADIVLVPAAWSDTGFCKRDTNRVDGIGWNATQKSNPALSGTLLHDRAIARTNITLDETGGVLRGILWHQGEADSDEQVCAENYAENLTELAASLRSNIDQDARGAIARGPASDVPFIAATMSKGNDARSEQSPFSERKQLVDNAHRNIANFIPLADFVNNDDLVPSAFPCGEGSCIHFGSSAYREMGNRYYETLRSLLP